MSKRSPSFSDDDDNDDDDVDNNKDSHIKQRVTKRVRDLEDKCYQYKLENKRLKSQLKKAQNSSGRLTKGGMRTENEWSGNEANLSDMISSFCVSYLFPRYKFLMDGWEKYNQDNKDSLSSFIKRKFEDDNRVDYEDQWDRIYVPTIASKYKTLRCNLNNAIREQYKGELLHSKCLCLQFVLTFAISN